MQKQNLLDSVTIPLECELREKIHNALQGDIVELLSDITEPSKAPFYLQGCKDGRAFKIEKGFFKKYYNLCEEVKMSLNFKEDVDVYIVSNPEVNAFAILRASEDHPHTIILNHSLVQMMTDDELKFAIGHEIGHLIKRDSRLNQLIDFVYPKDTKMPPSLTYKVSLWNQLSELECDRFGFLAMPKLSVCVSALFKLTTGFDLEKMEMNIEEFLSQIPNNLEYLFNDDFELEGSHPVNPIRIGALQIFSKKCASDKATDGYFDNMMNELIAEMTNISSSPLEKNLVKFFAIGGLTMISLKEEFQEEEYKVIISELSEFILNPKEYLEEIANDDDIFDTLQNVIDDILEVEPDLRDLMLEYLIRIALADKKIESIEVDTIMELGESMLGFSREEIAKSFANHIQKSFSPDILALV